jgi:hypothetical protein
MRAAPEAGRIEKTMDIDLDLFVVCEHGYEAGECEMCDDVSAHLDRPIERLREYLAASRTSGCGRAAPGLAAALTDTHASATGQPEAALAPQGFACRAVTSSESSLLWQQRNPSRFRCRSNGEG